MNDESDTPTAPDGQRGTAHGGTGHGAVRGARRGGTGHRRGHGRRGRVRGSGRARVWGAVAAVAVLGAGGLGTSLLFGGPTEASAGRPAASVVPGGTTVEPLKAPSPPSAPSRPAAKPSPGEPSATAPSPEPPSPASTGGKPGGGTEPGGGGSGNGTEGAGGAGAGGAGGGGGAGGTGTGGGTGGADPDPAPRDPAPEASSPDPAPRTTPSRTAGAVTEVATLVNTERNANGCEDITTDARLNRAARGHSRDMAERGYFDHTSPDGRGVGDRVTAAGYEWSAVGENIAVGQPTAVAVVEAWLESPGHRANILNCEYTQMGLGVDTSDGGPRWTQVFAAPQ